MGGRQSGLGTVLMSESVVMLKEGHIVGLDLDFRLRDSPPAEQIIQLWVVR